MALKKLQALWVMQMGGDVAIHLGRILIIPNLTVKRITLHFLSHFLPSISQPPPSFFLLHLQVPIRHVFSCDTDKACKMQITTNFPEAKFFENWPARLPMEVVSLVSFFCFPDGHFLIQAIKNS